VSWEEKNREYQRLESQQFQVGLEALGTLMGILEANPNAFCVENAERARLLNQRWEDLTKAKRALLEMAAL
jgi:hypothetical protein